MESWLWAIIAGLALSSPFIWFVWRAYRLGHHKALEEVGVFQVNDLFIEKVRHNIIADVGRLKLGGLTEQAMTDLIFETTRHSIANTFASVYRGNKFKVTADWPFATVVISGNIAVIKPWVGHDLTDKGEGIRAINVEVDRAPALKLDTRKTIKSVFEQAHPLPSSRTDEPRKVATIAAPRGPTSPAPPTTPAPRPAPRKATLKR